MKTEEDTNEIVVATKLETPTKIVKVEIEPGLFRRTNFQIAGHEDFYNQLVTTHGDVKKFYYKDDFNHWTVVDGPSDIPGLMDVFQDEVVKLHLEWKESSNVSCGTELRPSDLINILSEDKRVCLDVGSASVREVCATVSSSTTKLRIRRLDGLSKGLVSTDHVIGIFSEDGIYRLDVGAVYRESAASHDSWATLLHIRRVGDEGNNNCNYNRPLRYEELVGVFSHEHGKRLDLGSQSMKQPCQAYHSSWATRLKLAVKERCD